MFKKRLIAAVIFTMLFATSFITAYFVLYYNTAKIYQDDKKSSSSNASAQTVGLSRTPSALSLVNEKTKVKLIYSYMPVDTDGVIEKSVYENSKKDIIGMNEEQVKSYYEKMNYKVTSFSTDEIVVEADVIHSWPPKSYVVKADEYEIIVYTADEQGKLTMPQKTGIYLEMLPADDKEAVKKGKVYYKYDEVEELLDDYRS